MFPKIGIRAPRTHQRISDPKRGSSCSSFLISVSNPRPFFSESRQSFRKFSCQRQGYSVEKDIRWDNSHEFANFRATSRQGRKMDRRGDDRTNSDTSSRGGCDGATLTFRRPRKNCLFPNLNLIWREWNIKILFTAKIFYCLDVLWTSISDRSSQPIQAWFRAWFGSFWAVLYAPSSSKRP